MFCSCCERQWTMLKEMNRDEWGRCQISARASAGEQSCKRGIHLPEVGCSHDKEFETKCWLFSPSPVPCIYTDFGHCHLVFTILLFPLLTASISSFPSLALCDYTAWPISLSVTWYTEWLPPQRRPRVRVSARTHLLEHQQHVRSHLS